MDNKPNLTVVHSSSVTEVAGADPVTTYCEQLQKLASLKDKPLDFGVGDYVQWKPGLKNRMTLEYGVPAIVRKILDDPIYDPQIQSGSSYFREPLNLVIGLFDNDGDYIEMYCDSSRFWNIYQPIPEDEQA